MDWIKKLIEAIPYTWLKVVIAVLFAAIIAVACLYGVVGCSSPRTIAKVTNRAESTSTEIHMTTGDGGSVTVTATPNISVALDSTKIKK